MLAKRNLVYGEKNAVNLLFYFDKKIEISAGLIMFLSITALTNILKFNRKAVTRGHLECFCDGYISALAR